MVGGDFHVFVLLDVFKGFFEAEHHRGHDFGFIVSSRSAHIGQFFRFGYVDNDIFVLGALAHNLACIHFFLREDEEFPSVL